MKVKQIIILLLLCVFTLSATAQVGVYKGSSYGVSKIKKEQNFSYRGYVDGGGIFGSKGRAGFQLATGHGIQINPYLWVGIGLSYSYHDVNYDKFVSNDYNEVNDKYNIDDIRFYGDEQINFNCKLRSYHEVNLPLYLEIKANMMHDKKIIPFVALAGGLNILLPEAGGYGRLKLGLTHNNAKKTLGFTGFIGMEVTANYMSWDCYYEYKDLNSWGLDIWDHRYDSMYGYSYCLLFNVGVSFEFGGPAGLMPRVKK